MCLLQLQIFQPVTGRVDPTSGHIAIDVDSAAVGTLVFFYHSSAAKKSKTKGATK
jgi:hypothetical protein